MSDRRSPSGAEAIATDLTIVLTAASIGVEPGSNAEADLLKARGLARDLLAAHDPGAAARLDAQSDPRIRAAQVAADAARETPEHTGVLGYLIDAFTRRGGQTDGDGEILRLEGWFARPEPPLTAERLDAADAEDVLELTSHEVRAQLDTRGYIDASDASQPMAALWIALVHTAECRGGAAMSSEGPMPAHDPGAELDDALAALAGWLSYTAVGTRTTDVFRDRLTDRLAKLSHQAEAQYVRVEPASGDAPTPAQGIALARLLRGRLRDPSRRATVTLGDALSLPDGYIAVRFDDNFEAGIARDGATST